VLHRGAANARRRTAQARRAAHLTRCAHTRIYARSVPLDALRTAVAPQIAALETWCAVDLRCAEPELAASRACASDAGFTNRCLRVWALCCITRNRAGRIRHEGRHAFPRSITVRVAARNAEGETVEIVIAGTTDAPAESLVGTRKETCEPVRAVGANLARDPAIDAGSALACEARYAIIRVVTTGLDAKAAADGLIAGVRGIVAVLVVLACASPGGEATGEALAARRNTNLTDGTGGFVVTKGIDSRASWAEGARVAPGQPAIQNAAVGDARVGSTVRDTRITPVDPSVQIDGRVAPSISRDRGCSGFTTADHRRSGQQNVSKETHVQEGPRDLQGSPGPPGYGSVAPLPRARTPGRLGP
jgi:hypothetical protein